MSNNLTLIAFLVFLAGFGLLLFSLAELIMAFRRSKSRRMTSAASNWILRVVLFASGLFLIIISQSVFWFNSNLKTYSHLTKNIPLARISFVESDIERPRMILERFDENNQPIIADEILLEDTLIQIEMEVIKFKRLGNLFGLNEIYRFTRLIYLSDPGAYKEEYRAIPLGSRDNSITDFLAGIKKIVGVANTRTMLTDPFKLDTTRAFELSCNDMGLLQMFTSGTYSAEEESDY
jgi:hypothetical protein